MCRGGLPKAALIGFSSAVSDIMLNSGSKDDVKGSVAPGMDKGKRRLAHGEGLKGVLLALLSKTSPSP